MAKDKASTRKPRRRNARARDDGGTRRATEATPPVRASKRLSVQVSAAASAFLVNFRLRLDAIASIFVNYHEEREALVEKTEAADLIEQNVAEMMGVVYRGMLDSTADVLAAAVLRTEWKDDASAEDEGRSRKHLSRLARRVASFHWGNLTSQIADEGGPATHQLVAATVIPDRSALLIQFVVLPRKMGTGRDSLESDENVVTCFIDAAATLKRARKQGLLRLQFDFVLMLCRRLGVKDVFLFATEAGAPAWLTLGFEHVGSSASLIHLRFDLLFNCSMDRALKIFSDSAGLYPMALNIEGEAFDDDESFTSAVQERVAEYGEKQVVRLAKEAANAAAEAEAENDDDVPAAAADVPEHDLLAAPSPPRASSPPAPPAAPSPSALADASSSPPREAAAAPTSPEAAEPLEAAPPAPAPRRCAAASKKRVVDDADADDEDEAWEPGRPSMMDLDDDEQEQAAKAKRKLKRRSKKKSAKAKNAAGAAPHAPVSAPPAAAAAAPPEPSTTIAPAATQPVPAPAAAAAPPPRPLPKIRVFPQLSEVQKARLRMKDQEHIRRAARLHEAVTQEQERNAFLERIQAEEVRREQARIAAARPVPPPPNRATGAGDDSDEGWEESDEDDPVEDLIHRERIRERDLLRTPGCLALGRKAFRLEDMPRVTERDREILRRVLYILREAERRNCGELEVPRPREWALSDFGDTMTTEAIRARFDLRRLQRLFPNLDFRLSWSVRFNVVVQTIDAIALDSNLELTRVDMEVRRSTVGVYEDSLACQLLGQTYYVHPDKTIKITVDLVVTSEVIGTAPGRAEVHIKELGFHFVDPLAPIAEKEIVPRVRVFIPYLGIEGWISITSLDDGHLIVELKYLQAMHVKNRMLKKCCYTLYLVELADRLRAEASRETLKTARKNVVEAEGDYQLALSNYRQQELWCSQKFDMVVLARPTLARVIRKFANAIARKAAEARGETFVPTPYDETAVDAVVVTAVPPVAPVVAPEPAPPAVAAMDVSAPAGPPLKALEGMDKKECNAELDAAGVPKAGRPKAASEILRDLVRRLRAGEPAASLKVPRKPKSAEELFCCDKAEQLACRATLVADGAKKVVFQYGRPGNGTDYLVARWRGLAETDPLRLEFDELARRDVAAAAADELPVDRLQRVPDPGLMNLPTIWPRMRYAQPECGVRYPYGSKLGLFKGRCFGCCVWAQCAARPEEFPNLLKALATVPRVSLYLTAVDVNDMETLRARARMCYRVIRDAKRRTSSSTKPRAEDDACPAYYGVDYREMRGALTCQFTVHEGTKTSGRKSAPADPRFEAVSGNGTRGNVLKHPTAVAVYRERLERKNRIAGGIAVFNFPWHPYEALRSLENAFSEFMPERFYGINDRAKDGCPAGKVMALASIPGVAKAGDGCIVFGLYDSKVEAAAHFNIGTTVIGQIVGQRLRWLNDPMDPEIAAVKVSIQEKNRISEVVVARIEEHNVARAGAEKPLPPLHVAGLERYKADFALQLKDLAYVEAADEAYLRDQAAALAPPEPMPDGSRPPIDAHSRRVARAGLANTFERMIERRRDRAAREREEAQTAASTAAVANFYRDPCGLLEPRALAPPGQPRRVAKLYVVPNCEVVTPPPPPIYHVTENGERLLVLYATRVQRPLIPAIQQVHKQRAEFLSLFDESEVEMAAAMFDSRPIEIARPLLFESEEDAERRAEPAAPKRKRKSRKKKRKAAAAAAAAAAAERGDEAAPAADGAAEPAAAPEAPAEALAEAPPTAPPVEAPAEAAPAAAPAKKKKKKRSRRRGPAPPAEISEYERTRMRNIAAGNKKLYSLGLINPPPEVVADPEHSWWSERAQS